MGELEKAKAKMEEENEKKRLRYEADLDATAANMRAAEGACSAIEKEMEAHADECETCAARWVALQHLGDSNRPTANVLVTRAGELYEEMRKAKEQVSLAGAAMRGR